MPSPPPAWSESARSPREITPWGPPRRRCVVRVCCASPPNTGVPAGRWEPAPPRGFGQRLVSDYQSPVDDIIAIAQSIETSGQANDSIITPNAIHRLAKPFRRSVPRPARCQSPRVTALRAPGKALRPSPSSREYEGRLPNISKTEAAVAAHRDAARLITSKYRTADWRQYRGGRRKNLDQVVRIRTGETDEAAI